MLAAPPGDKKCVNSGNVVYCFDFKSLDGITPCILIFRRKKFVSFGLENAHAENLYISIQEKI